MNAESIQKILIPYLEATAVLLVVIAVAAYLMKRDGARAKVEPHEVAE